MQKYNFMYYYYYYYHFSWFDKVTAFGKLCTIKVFCSYMIFTQIFFHTSHVSHFMLFRDITISLVSMYCTLKKNSLMRPSYNKNTVQYLGLIKITSWDITWTSWHFCSLPQCSVSVFAEIYFQFECFQTYWQREIVIKPITFSNASLYASGLIKKSQTG